MLFSRSPTGKVKWFLICAQRPGTQAHSAEPLLRHLRIQEYYQPIVDVEKCFVCVNIAGVVITFPTCCSR
jgi:hypothetical protein